MSAAEHSAENQMFTRFTRVIIFAIIGFIAIAPGWNVMFRGAALDFEGIGRAVGIAGLTLLCFQLILAARSHMLDALFGLDSLLQIHRRMGMLTGILLISHPILLAVEAGIGLLTRFDLPWPVILGKITLVMLVIMVAGILITRIDFNLRKRIHGLIAILVLVLGLIHARFVGHFDSMLEAWWWTLAAVTAATLFFRFVYQPVVRRQEYRVVDVKQETKDVWTIHFAAASKSGGMHFMPGQFAFIGFKRPDRPSEEHPFTLSSSPVDDGRSFTISVKKSGNFTNTIDQTQVGDAASVDGSFGRFSYELREPGKILFIIGGVGITPAMSMLRTLREKADTRPVRLLYGNVDEESILFRDELENMPDNVRVMHVLSDPADDWSGARGLIDRDRIESFAGDFLGDANIYFCGPPPMMDIVEDGLHELEVDESRIHSERFSL